MIYIVFIINLLLTCFVEGLIIYILFQKMKFVYYSFLCNMLTNPTLNLLLLLLLNLCGYEYYWIFLIVLEIVVIMIEAYVYSLLCNLIKVKALCLSALLNLASFLFGLLIFNF